MDRRCCVCGAALGEGAPSIGDRAYCHEHFSRVFAHRKGVWIAALAGIAASAVFVLAMSLAGTGPDSGEALRLLVGVLVSGFPAAVWISVFYRLDALEREPKERIFELFVLGALLAGGALLPLFDRLLPPPSGGWQSAISAILVVGFASEYCKFAIVRFTVFRGEKFNERTDGIVYGAAVGLGYAFAANLSRFVGSGLVDLSVAAMGISVETLGQASFSGIAGWFLAGMKFRDMRPWWMPLGLATASVSNGVFHVMSESVSRQGLDYSPWNSFALSGAFALAVFGTLFYLSRRATKQAFSALRTRTGEVDA